MKHSLNNPFVTGGYIGPEYFCNRKDETTLLLNAIASTRKVRLISLRRMGKTGLLKHVKYQLEKLFALLASLRPKITYNSLSGQPALELNIQSAADIQFGLTHFPINSFSN